MAEREASGDFDYLWDDPADAYGLTSHDQARQSRPVEDPAVPPNEPDDDQWDEPDDSFWENQPDPRDQGHFDAFNDDTWSFAPAPTPWYRTGPAVTAIIAASAAMVAIVVSGVLLVFRGPASTVDQVTSSVTPTAPTSAAPVQVASSEQPPPPAPPPPPPPSETQASQVNTAPGNNPVIESRPTKAPEIGVTRTPITRYPISVAPQPHGGRNGLLH